MSVSVQTMPGNPLHDQHDVGAHKLSPMTQQDSLDFIGHVDETNLAPTHVDGSYQDDLEALDSTKQNQQAQPLASIRRDNYDKYARTKQRNSRVGGARGKSSFKSKKRSGDAENKDPETPRPNRATVRYAVPPDTPVAPPTTPVSQYIPSNSASPRPLITPVEAQGGRGGGSGDRFAGGGHNEVYFERCESRQGRYHEECKPRVDPTNVIGSRARRDKLNSARSTDTPRRRRPSSLASTSSSLLSNRESVVNLVYSGIEGFTETQWVPIPPSKRRASTVFAKMATLTPHPDDVTHCEYETMQEDEYSLGRFSRNRSCTSINSTSVDHFPPKSGGFLYQIVGFDTLSHGVPHFVKQNFQKNGKLVTESFILKVNYLRRRRALGDLNNANNNNNTSSKRAQKVSDPKKDKSAHGRGDHHGPSDHL